MTMLNVLMEMACLLRSTGEKNNVTGTSYSIEKRPQEINVSVTLRPENTSEKNMWVSRPSLPVYAGRNIFITNECRVSL